MQHPVGYAIRNGRAELTDFAAVVFNSFGILTILHTLPAAYILAVCFVMGITAYHLHKKQHVDFFTRSFKIGLVFAFWGFRVFLILLPTSPLQAEDHPRWEAALPVYEFSFPRDHHSHPDFKTEWWYATGNLTSPEGDEYGYQFTIFRQGIRPPGSEPKPTSPTSTPAQQ